MTVETENRLRRLLGTWLSREVKLMKERDARRALGNRECFDDLLALVNELFPPQVNRIEAGH